MQLQNDNRETLILSFLIKQGLQVTAGVYPLFFAVGGGIGSGFLRIYK